MADLATGELAVGQSVILRNFVNAIQNNGVRGVIVSRDEMAGCWEVQPDDSSKNVVRAKAHYIQAAPEAAAIAAYPSIALALRQGDAAALDSTTAQLRDLVTQAPADAAAAVCVAVAKSDDLVDAAFVQALGRADLSDAAQHALATTMMALLVHDDAKDASTALMRACPVYLPVLLRLIAQELPVSTCR